MKESYIGSLSTLINWLDKLNEDNVNDRDHVFVFRGHPNSKYALVPSVYRLPEWQSNEDQMIRQILLRCPTEFRQMDSAFEKLVKMQHYNMPTRLLDVTENPLVALYFACAGSQLGEEGVDGEIIFCRVPKRSIKYFDSDVVSIISNVAWSPNDFEVHHQFSRNADRFHDKNNHHASKLLHDIRREKPHFEGKINPRDVQKVVCVKPIIDNPRLAQQDGLFFLFGIDGNKTVPAAVPDDWSYRPRDKRLLVRKSDKLKILNQLQKVGISKAKLFPEIDTVSQFIKHNPELDPIEFRSSILKSQRNIVIPKMYY